jgi:hypothetical protein
MGREFLVPFRTKIVVNLLSKIYKTMTKHISQGSHPQSMPQMRLLIFYLLYNSLTWG